MERGMNTMERGQSHDEIPSYCGWSIFTALCCCWPFGLTALIYSNKVDTANASGEFQKAADASSTAKTLNIMGLVCRIILLIVFAYQIYQMQPPPKIQ
uniref:Proline-rich transmembrane protein 1 n=1 Tax=Salarias fasciatus TaxID=181472 RepID=A0A672HDH6_SALFA